MYSLEQAVEAHLSGHLEAAVAFYLAVLEQDPFEPLALHYYGLYLHQVGQHDQAMENLQLASVLQPQNAMWHNDRGNVLFSLANFDMARRAYEDALALTDTDHVIWNNLGATQLKLAQLTDAMSSFSRALEIAPQFVPALLHLGDIYEKSGDKITAAHYQCRAYVLPPLEGKSKEMLGISFYFLGRLTEAAQAYRDWLSEEPDNPIAKHMLAACSQQNIPPRASDGYIEQYFDRYAERFDKNLVNSLEYHGPEMINVGLAWIAQPDRQFSIVDIGCGTGICGRILSPYSSRLIGVDLAGKMLQRAVASGHYDVLIKAEIGSYLANSPDSCDLIAAADTMIYFGNLAPIFNQVAAALHETGYFVFTVEALEPEEVGTIGFLLHASGRYRHGRDYVIECLAQANLELIYHSFHVLRLEIGKGVPGIVFVAKKGH